MLFLKVPVLNATNMAEDGTLYVEYIVFWSSQLQLEIIMWTLKKYLEAGMLGHKHVIWTWITHYGKKQYGRVKCICICETWAFKPQIPVTGLNQRHCLFHTKHSTLLSKPGAYITHNATTMQATEWQHCKAIYQITCSFLWSHRRPFFPHMLNCSSRPINTH